MPDSITYIVVIDDTPHVLAFLEYFLRAEGFDVAAVGVATDADAAFAYRRPDLIISDLTMWGGAGRALLDLLDGDEKMRGTPVLWCTASVPDARGVAALPARDSTAVLLKPFDIDDLLLCVARLSNQERR